MGVDWKLDYLLGVGGFGEVWKARNPHVPSVEPVALKFCLDPAAAKMLRNEADILDRLMRQGKHPGVLQLLRTYLSAETPCLEYEYVDGGDLTGLIQEWHRTKGGPTPQQAAEVILRLAEIVGFVHLLEPPIVHRDLKPANILVQRTAVGETHFKIADFGIGGVAVGQAIREISRGSRRGWFLTSAVHGTYTPLYASPQQLRGELPDPRDDVYSLGVIWYQLLTGDLTNGRPGGSRWRKKLLEQGMPSEMAELLECCFEDNPEDRPRDADALAGLLRSLESSWNSSNAHTELKAASSLAETLVACAETRLDEGVCAQASADAPEVIRLDPEDDVAYDAPEEANRQKGEFDLAIADATQAIRLDPEDAWAYYARARAYRQKGEFDLAIADATQAIRLDSHQTWAYFTRARAYRQKGEFDLAIADATQAIRLDPEDASAYRIQAEVYRLKGDFDRAVSDCDEAIRLDPKDASAYATRGAAYSGKGDFDRAIADCDEAIRLDPKDASAYATRGAAYRMKGNYHRAISSLTEALRLAPEPWANARRPSAQSQPGTSQYEWVRDELEVAKQDLARTQREREQQVRRDAESGLVACPDCQVKLRVSQELVGMKVKCPDCSCVFVASSVG
jgi:tetratricopeptide (TPR) repeat protein